MVNRRSLLMAFGALVGLTLTAGGSAVSAMNSREKLTFSGAVALPGVTLPAGSYEFGVANPNSDGSIIVVRELKTQRVCFLGFTYRAPRPAGMREDRSITLGEAPKGQAAPIVAWYPRGESSGHEFIYR